MSERKLGGSEYCTAFAQLLRLPSEGPHFGAAFLCARVQFYTGGGGRGELCFKQD